LNDLRNFILAHLGGTQPAGKLHLSVIFAASRRDPSLPGSGPRCYSPSAVPTVWNQPELGIRSWL